MLKPIFKLVVLGYCKTLWKFAGRGECVRSRGELRLKRNVGRARADEVGRWKGREGRGALSRRRGEERRGEERRGGCSVQHVEALLLQWMASAEARKEGIGRK